MILLQALAFVLRYYSRQRFHTLVAIFHFHGHKVALRKGHQRLNNRTFWSHSTTTVFILIYGLLIHCYAIPLSNVIIP